MTTPTTPAASAPAAPKNGAAPAAPQQPVVPPTQVAPDPVAEYRTRAERAEAEAARAKRDELTRTRQWARERQTFGEKLKSADEYERIKREAKINPKSAAEKLWGPNYLEHLNTTAANGNVPTAESVALAIEEREQALERKYAERDAQRAKESSDAEQRQLDAQVRHFRGGVLAEMKATATEYPLSAEQFKTPEALADAVFNYIVNRHEATTQRDPETGQVLRAGSTMTAKEAASELEETLAGIGVRMTGHAKYADRLREKLTPPKPGGSVPPVKQSLSASQSPQSVSQSASQGRKTLGNDMTGSTPAESPKHKTDSERWAAAIALGKAAMKQG